MKNEYIDTLKSMLGEELFHELSEELFRRVAQTFRRPSVQKALKYVKYNMSLILIIGIELSRGCPKEDLEKRLLWHELYEKSLMLEKNIDNTIQVYEKYIKVIIEKAKEQTENQSNI